MLWVDVLIPFQNLCKNWGYKMSTLIGRVGLVPQGVWSAGNYKLLDVVSYQGKSYVCRANTSTTPSEGANWMVLASDGVGGETISPFLLMGV